MERLDKTEKPIMIYYGSKIIVQPLRLTPTCPVRTLCLFLQIWSYFILRAQIGVCRDTNWESKDWQAWVLFFCCLSSPVRWIQSPDSSALIPGWGQERIDNQALCSSSSSSNLLQAVVSMLMLDSLTDKLCLSCYYCAQLSSYLQKDNLLYLVWHKCHVWCDTWNN